MTRTYRALARCVRERFVRPESPGRNILAEDKWKMLLNLDEREKASRTTCLRDVHAILDMAQPKALRVVRSLEFDNLVRIGDNLHDAMACEVQLTEQGHALMLEAREAA